MFRFNPALQNLSDSSNDEIERPPPRRLRRRKVYKQRVNMELFDEKGFKQRFRLSKSTVLSVLQLIGHLLISPTMRNQAITPLQQLLLTLRFYAMGSMLLTAGDFAGVSVASACRIVWRVTKALAHLRPQYITFSNNLATAANNFYLLSQFPRVLGAIDCTHVRIQSPGGDDAEIFRNRKDYFSINVQTVAGPDLKIMNIVAKWPGSAHDATIFDNSRLKDRLEQEEFGKYWLLGDSAYPLKPYLLTPLANPASEAEQKYNRAHIATRNPVERSYGVWKRRFPVLALKMRLHQERILAVIVSTAVLHNIAIDAREDLLPPEVDIPSSSDDEEPQINGNQNRMGQNIRANLIRDHFAQL